MSTRTPRCVRIEIRPGEGGEEAAVFAGELATSITAHLRRHGCTPDQAADRRTVVVSVATTGDIIAAVRQIAGTHRAQRDSRARGSKRHTATAHIAVVDELAHAAVDIGDEELRIDTFRSGGNGGQHAQKNDTAVRITHLPTGIVVTSRTQRSQWRNLQHARADLAGRLAALEQDRVVAAQNEMRRAGGLGPAAAEKQFTHNSQRGEVIDHQTGRRWKLRDFQRGKLA